MENNVQTVQKKDERTGWQKTKAVLKKISDVIDIILTVIYRLRKIIMAAPVVYYAIKLAQYNMEHLPAVVGVNMQSNGIFTEMISREVAVMGPLAITGICLLLMFFSRKALYSWAISIFTLMLPILLLFSNRYPA